MELWTLVNEEELGKEVFDDNSTINNWTNVRLKCYIKYLKNVKKMNKVSIRNEVDKLMMNNYSGFIMGDWDETLSYMVNKYTKVMRVWRQNTFRTN